MLYTLSPWFHPIEPKPQDMLVLEVLGALLGVVSGTASLVIWFGMVVFCLCEDRSPLSGRIFWFILFFAAAWFGAAAYFFVVYRKQVR